MKKVKKSMKVLATTLSAIAFLAVFLVNMTVVVKKDGKTGSLSLSSMKSYAQGGEGPTINCASYGSLGQCWVLVIGQEECNCEYSGGTLDYCDAGDAWDCNGY